MASTCRSHPARSTLRPATRKSKSAREAIYDLSWLVSNLRSPNYAVRQPGPAEATDNHAMLPAWIGEVMIALLQSRRVRIATFCRYAEAVPPSIGSTRQPPCEILTMGSSGQRPIFVRTLSLHSYFSGHLVRSKKNFNGFTFLGQRELTLSVADLHYLW